jgi:hypothetical protein
MKYVLALVVITSCLFGLTGCGSSGSSVGSNSFADIGLSDADLAAVESALVANRIEALDTAALPSASILADVSGTPAAAFQYRGKQYRGGQSGSRKQAQRGTGSCQIALDVQTDGTSLLIASETCKVERTITGGYKIIRANGTELVIEKPADGTERTTLTVNGATWGAWFGDGTTTPLVTLKNDRSGRTITISEDDSGNLTVVGEGGRACRGYWNADGTIEAAEEGSGRQYRYRGGR